MRAEYRYAAIFAFWMILWALAPAVALPLMLFMVIRHFVLIRRERRLQEVAVEFHGNGRDVRWAEREGFGEEKQADPADWWKR